MYLQYSYSRDSVTPTLLRLWYRHWQYDFLYLARLLIAFTQVTIWLWLLTKQILALFNNQQNWSFSLSEA